MPLQSQRAVDMLQRILSVTKVSCYRLNDHKIVFIGLTLIRKLSDSLLHVCSK